MQMDSYYFQDEIPSFYPHGGAPASQELPFGLDAPLPADAFHDYYGAAAGAQQQGTEEGTNAHRLGMMEVDRDQCQMRGEEEEEGEGEGEEKRRRHQAGNVESSRGFRHMMRERQRREKLSQSYADLYAMVAARSKGDKNSIVQAAAIHIHELKGAREQLQRRNEDLKARILGHDARQPSVKLDFEVDDPACGIDSMIGALRRLKSMGVKARGIRSNMSSGRLWTEMNVETTIAACEVEKAVEEALMKEVERKQQQPDSGAAPFPGTTATGWGPQAATHVQNVF
ncbi:hypothetical protein PR202_ga13406 [Eleusine coracana subsp. coracana]|uniref:BHLH domain-containing protein n=1 Tax=Eleusine coracana subsp. coracana TaxID=191504 RepID=A0AAV5CE73_ELECO|nr:hypothetical protein QOZ80_3BG0262080 [Eleusine coracana subsp. coracana]GJM96558.1 hypothetical protein PR202_ga13406 [Eleusine coracana subsp. coracana]